MTATVEPAGSGGRAQPAGSGGRAQPAGSGGEAQRAGSGGEDEPLVGAKPRALLDLTAGELALRFVLGAVASVAAGLVAQAFGARTGGIPLALPAIFVASITLEQRKGGRDQMQHQVTGAPLGALGMVAFALTVVALLERLPLAAVLAVATLAWAAVAFVAYLVTVAVRRRRPSDAT